MISLHEETKAPLSPPIYAASVICPYISLGILPKRSVTCCNAKSRFLACSSILAIAHSMAVIPFHGQNSPFVDIIISDTAHYGKQERALIVSRSEPLYDGEQRTRPPAGGPGRGSDVPPARHSLPLPSSPLQSITKKKHRPWAVFLFVNVRVKGTKTKKERLKGTCQTSRRMEIYHKHVFCG